MIKTSAFLFVVSLVGVMMTHRPLCATTQPHTMVVFVHGTLFGLPTLKTLLDLNSENKINLANLLRGGIYQDFLRKGRSRYYCHQAIQEVGLHETQLFHSTSAPQTNPYAKKKIPATPSLASGFAHVYNHIHNEDSRTFSFYTYGWSGKLESASRRKWAESMYHEIFDEHQKLKALHGKSTQLIILTHSHGGNVALNLASCEQKHKKGLYIDELLNFGAPVQSETEKYADAPLFGNVYHFYSPGDVIQIADTISTKDFFSRRAFSKTTSGRVVQIEVSVDNTTPRHAELWFMGLSPIFYRPTLSIYPFPICVFAPLLIDAVKKEHPETGQIKVKLCRRDGEYMVQTLDKTTGKKGNSTYKLSPEWDAFTGTHTNLLKPQAEKQASGMKKILYTTGIVALGGLLYHTFTSKKTPKK